jgi:hypothetical protein
VMLHGAPTTILDAEALLWSITLLHDTLRVTDFLLSAPWSLLLLEWCRVTMSKPIPASRFTVLTKGCAGSWRLFNSRTVVDGHCLDQPNNVLSVTVLSPFAWFLGGLCHKRIIGYIYN